MSIDGRTRRTLDLGYEMPGPFRIVLGAQLADTGLHGPRPYGDAPAAGERWDAEEPWEIDDGWWLDEDDEPPGDPPPGGTAEGVLWVLLAVVVGQAVGLWGCDGTLRCTADACARLGLAPPDAEWRRGGMSCDCAVWQAVLGRPDVPARWPPHIGDPPS